MYSWYTVDNKVVFNGGLQDQIGDSPEWWLKFFLAKIQYDLLQFCHH